MLAHLTHEQRAEYAECEALRAEQLREHVQRVVRAYGRGAWSNHIQDERDQADDHARKGVGCSIWAEKGMAKLHRMPWERARA